MVQSLARSGVGVSFSSEHRNGSGELISRQATIEAPRPITCIKVSCLWRYLIKSLTYTMILLYDKQRVVYAEKHRGKEIPLKYRTGEPSPNSITQALIEILRLKLRR